MSGHRGHTNERTEVGGGTIILSGSHDQEGEDKVVHIDVQETRPLSQRSDRGVGECHLTIPQARAFAASIIKLCDEIEQ